MWVEDGHIQLPETCTRFNSETHQIFSTRHIEISRGPQTSSESPIWRGCNLHLCSLNFVFEETPRPLEGLRTALKARWRNLHIYTGRPRSIVTKIGIISISMFLYLFSISSYSLMYSGIVDFRKFASQANSKHFFMGQKKSALTSFKFSSEATI